MPDDTTLSTAPNNQSDGVYLVSYPKVIFLYPSFMAAIFAAIYMSLFAAAPPAPADEYTVLVSAVFLIVLGVNLVVLGFDFPRATSLALFLAIAVIVMGLVLMSVLRPHWLGSLAGIFRALHPVANATFYWIFAAMMGVIYLFMFISVRFDYWEVRPNELLHHHGMLSDLKRYSAPELRVDKEINDIFEYLLLGAGRLVLHPSGEKRAVILENVLFITRKERQLTRMLGALQVQVRSNGGDR